MGQIVYHGTWGDEPPHAYGEPFHVGTKRATDDRAADQMMGGDVEPPATRRVHAYEISATAPMSRRLWDDPDYKSFSEPDEPARPVPQHKENRIYPYLNAREDKGSVSYVIPAGFVGKHVKHLGVQFEHFFGPEDM
jgi:hypothetical protein